MGGYSGQALTDWRNGYRAKKRKRGECYECSSPVEPYHTLCPDHLRRRRERAKAARPAATDPWQWTGD